MNCTAGQWDGLTGHGPPDGRPEFTNPTAMQASLFRKLAIALSCTRLLFECTPAGPISLPPVGRHLRLTIAANLGDQSLS